MKKLKNRLTALVLTLAMVLALAPVMTASAEGAYSPEGLGANSTDITPRKLYHWEYGTEDYDLEDWIDDVLPKHREDLGIHGKIDHWSEIPGALVQMIELMVGLVPAVFIGVPYEFAKEYVPGFADASAFWGRYTGPALAAAAARFTSNSNGTMLQADPEQARIKCSVYSACGSFFWDEACTVPVQELNNRSNNVIGYTIVAPDNGTWYIPRLNDLHVTYTLPDGFQFGNGEKTYEEGFNPAGYAGNAAWAWLPSIYPDYVGGAAPDTYYCVRVDIEGTYSMSNNAGNYWEESVNGSVEVPFCYVADGWNSVAISGGEIGSTTVNWDSEYAFQTNHSASAYGGGTAKLSAALTALSQDANATVDVLRRMGFRSVVVNGGNEQTAGMGVITGTKVLSDGNFTIGVVTGAAGDSDWLAGLDAGSDIRYAKDIYPAAAALRHTVTEGVYGIRDDSTGRGSGADHYVLCTGFGKAGAVAAEMANIISDTLGRPFVTAYTFGAPNYRRQGAPAYRAYVYNLVYTLDPICALPSGQYYQALGETYYLPPDKPVADQGDGVWTDLWGVKYRVVNWMGKDAEGEAGRQCTTVNELAAAALYAWDPYNPSGDTIRPETYAYLAKVESVLRQYGTSLSEVSGQAHSMYVYWMLLNDCGDNMATLANASEAPSTLHWRLATLWNQFFRERPAEEDSGESDTATPAEPSDPGNTGTGGNTPGGGSSMECHTFEGDASVVVNNSEGRPVAMIASVPGQSPVSISVNRQVTVFSSGDQNVVLITEPEEEEEKFTIQLLAADDDYQDNDRKETTVTHTVYQASSERDAVTVLEQGDVTVSSAALADVPATDAGNITARPTENTYAKSDVKTDTGTAKVSSTVPTLYSGNPVRTDVAYPNTVTVTIDGKQVEFQMYSLKDEKGNNTSYIKIRDLALALKGTKAQFDVGLVNGVITFTGGGDYKPNGSENKTPYSGQQSYTKNSGDVSVNGTPTPIDAFQITYNGGGYTYFQLRDIGQKLNFNVGWSKARGSFIETDKPYTGK